MINKNKMALLLALNMVILPGCREESNNNVQMMMQDTSLVELNTKENEKEKKIILHDENGNIYEYDKENNNIVSLEEYVEIQNKKSIKLEENNIQNGFIVQENNTTKENDKLSDVTEPEIVTEVDAEENLDILINKSQDNITEYKMAYVTEDTSLYNITTLSQDTEIERFQKVIVIETYEEYSLIQTEEDYMAYIENNKIEVLPDTFVEIDISDQTMNLYKDGEVILSSSVVTGSNRHCTDLCYKPIYKKSRNTYLTGPTWRSYVNYWMPFNGGMGLHDASWRSEFGGEIYKENGSHGCVNLPNSIAKELFENVEVGTMVLVKK